MLCDLELSNKRLRRRRKGRKITENNQYKIKAMQQGKNNKRQRQTLGITSNYFREGKELLHPEALTSDVSMM
jgi:hypothetical protein